MTELNTEDYTEIEQILHRHPAGRGVYVAETILRLLAEGQLGRLRRLVFQRRFELRRINDPQAFRAAIQHPAFEALNCCSTPLGYAVSVFDKEQSVLHTTFFCDHDLHIDEAAVLTSATTQHTALSFQALGLDVPGIKEALEQAEANDTPPRKPGD